MKSTKVLEKNRKETIKFLCIGVESIGCSAVAYITKKAMRGVNCISIGTDSKMLKNHDVLQEVCEGINIVFIIAELGENTVALAFSNIVKIAKKSGAFTISVITKPFRFETEKYLKRESDSVIIIQNGTLAHLTLSDAVIEIIKMVNSKNEDDVNLGLADLKTTMQNKDISLVVVGRSMDEAMRHVLSDNTSLHDVTGILINFYTNTYFPMELFNEAMDFMNENAHSDASIILGSTTDRSLKSKDVKVTMILSLALKNQD